MPGFKPNHINKRKKLLRGVGALSLRIVGASFVWFCAFWVKFLLRFRRTPANQRLVILPAFFPANAGTRWRVESWTKRLEKEGIQTEVRYLWDSDKLMKFRKAASPFEEIHYLIRRSLLLVGLAYRSDRLLVRRQMVPFADAGSHLPERVAAFLYRERILDLDDDIASAKGEPLQLTSMGKLLGYSERPFTAGLNYYNRFIVGNKVLKDKILTVRPEINPENDILVLPTCFDAEEGPAKDYRIVPELPAIGWLGSDGNQYVLDYIVPALNALKKEHAFTLCVVSGMPWSHPEAEFPVVNKTWSLETEKAEMRNFDIGIMPLTGREHEAGKSGFKLIQYCMMGLVTVASETEVNREILGGGSHGFLVSGELSEWTKTLSKVLETESAWSTIGQRARDHSLANYSFQANVGRLIKFLSESKG